MTKCYIKSPARGARDITTMKYICLDTLCSQFSPCNSFAALPHRMMQHCGSSFNQSTTHPSLPSSWTTGSTAPVRLHCNLRNYLLYSEPWTAAQVTAEA